MKKTWTKVVVVALSCMMVFMLAACGGGGSDAGDAGAVLLGNTGPLTGPAAIYGNAVKNGGQLAVDEINAANPDGIQLAWQAEDDEADGPGDYYPFGAPELRIRDDDADEPDGLPTDDDE